MASQTLTSGNGVQTPSPIQDGMKTKCKAFYLVKSEQTCDVIIREYRVTLENIISWNPAVKSDCTGMWANTYACVAVLGEEPRSQAS